MLAIEEQQSNYQHPSTKPLQPCSKTMNFLARFAEEQWLDWHSWSLSQLARHVLTWPDVTMLVQTCLRGASVFDIVWLALSLHPLSQELCPLTPGLKNANILPKNQKSKEILWLSCLACFYARLQGLHMFPQPSLTTCLTHQKRSHLRIWIMVPEGRRMKMHESILHHPRSRRIQSVPTLPSVVWQACPPPCHGRPGLTQDHPRRCWLAAFSQVLIHMITKNWVHTAFHQLASDTDKHTKLSNITSKRLKAWYV